MQLPVQHGFANIYVPQTGFVFFEKSFIIIISTLKKSNFSEIYFKFSEIEKKVIDS